MKSPHMHCVWQNPLSHQLVQLGPTSGHSVPQVPQCKRLVRMFVSQPSAVVQSPYG